MTLSYVFLAIYTKRLITMNDAAPLINSGVASLNRTYHHPLFAKGLQHTGFTAWQEPRWDSSGTYGQRHFLLLRLF